MADRAYANRSSILTEYVPLILSEVHKLMQLSPKLAINFMECLQITNEIVKEHLTDLCLNKDVKQSFDTLTTQQKT